MTTSTAFRPRPGPVPAVIPGRTRSEQILVRSFVLIPFAALVAAVPIGWGWGRPWLDISARSIWIFEKPGWVSGVRWTNPARLARITAPVKSP